MITPEQLQAILDKKIKTETAQYERRRKNKDFAQANVHADRLAALQEVVATITEAGGFQSQITLADEPGVKLLSMREAAERLGITVSGLYERVRKGQIKGVQVAGRGKGGLKWVFPADEVEERADAGTMPAGHVTLAEAAKALRITESGLNQRIARGAVKVVKGRWGKVTTIIARAELEAQPGPHRGKKKGSK